MRGDSVLFVGDVRQSYYISRFFLQRLKKNGR